MLYLPRYLHVCCNPSCHHYFHDALDHTKLHRKSTDCTPKSSSKSSRRMRFDVFFYGVSPFQFEGREAMEDEREMCYKIFNQKKTLRASQLTINTK